MKNQEEFFSTDQVKSIIADIQYDFDQKCHKIYCKNSKYRSVYFALEELKSQEEFFNQQKNLKSDKLADGFSTVKDAYQSYLDLIMINQQNCTQYKVLKNDIAHLYKS